MTFRSNTNASITDATQLLKRYRPLETRAEGGFGSVEICLDTRLQRRVAIKRIPLHSPTNYVSEATLNAALTEARTASLLQHPNIVSVIDFQYDNSYAYLVMEYVDGLSLAEYLNQVEGQSLTYDEAAALADALCSALKFAHENGVLHLDIKPANVLIDRRGHIKLADFGMSTLTSAAGFGGARGGTIGYMSPEQLRGDNVDERSDIFSLGTILYESLLATAPFRGATPQDSLNRIYNGVLYPSDLLPGIPDTCEDALLSAMAPDSANRFTSIEEFADLFLHHLGNIKEGKKSFARMIERITADDTEAYTSSELSNDLGKSEIDPSEGFIGSRYPHAKQISIGICSFFACTISIFILLTYFGITGWQAIISSCAIGIAAAIAPQMGSALTFVGVLFAVGENATLAGILPLALILFVPMATWWIVWGREQPIASCLLLMFTALGLSTQHPLAWAGVVASLAGYLLPAHCAAVTSFVGIFFSQVFFALNQNFFSISFNQFIVLFSTLNSWVALIGCPIISVAIALFTQHVIEQYTQQEKVGTWYVSVLLFVGIVSMCFSLVQWCVENDSAFVQSTPHALLIGLFSSILIAFIAFAFGYPTRTQ